MNLDRIRPVLGRFFGKSDAEDEGNVSRRHLLLGLGCAGFTAFAVPTLLMPSQAEAAGISIHIGPRRRWRRRRRRRFYRRPRIRGFRRRRRRRRRRWGRRRRRRYW